jgi:flagellin
MTSINTNPAAMVALETLRNINTNLESLNNQISTGKKVNNARDNASVWSIAKTMDSDIMSFKTVTESLSLASSTIGVARTASESITDLLVEVKSLVTQAQNKSADDRTKIQAEITALSDQITDIVSAAQFNGVNLLDNTTDVDFLSSFNRAADGSVTTDTIRVTGRDLRVGSAGTFTPGTFADGTSGNIGAGGAGNFVSTAVGAADGTPATGITILDAATLVAGDAIQISYTAGGTAGAGENFTAEYVVTGNEADNAAIRTAIANAINTAAGETVATVSGDNIQFVRKAIDTTNGETGAYAFAEATGAGTTSGVITAGSLGGLGSLDVIDATNGVTALTTIETLINTAKDTSAAFGTAQKRIDIQSEFITNLIDSLELGVSALTDVDLPAASAKLNALQVQQQLGLQSLAIANSAPQTILALFR